MDEKILIRSAPLSLLSAACSINSVLKLYQREASGVQGIGFRPHSLCPAAIPLEERHTEPSD